MKILFKNTTIYTKATYDKFLAFHNQKFHFLYSAYTLMVVAFILFGLILQVQAHNFTLAILLCCTLTAFILWRFFRPISEVSKEYKSEKIQKEKRFTFKFYQKFFTIEDEKEFSKIKYYQLYRVFELSDFFYLYIDKTHAFLVDKTKFKENNLTSFSHFIRRKCWWCYKK